MISWFSGGAAAHLYLDFKPGLGGWIPESQKMTFGSLTSRLEVGQGRELDEPARTLQGEQQWEARYAQRVAAQNCECHPLQTC